MGANAVPFVAAWQRRERESNGRRSGCPP